MTVLPMVVGSAVCMFLFSLLTPPPSPGDAGQVFQHRLFLCHQLILPREQLDAHAREIVRWHFSPETGSPFWLDWAAKAGWNPAAEVKCFADLQRFPHFQDEWLRDLQPEVWVPEKIPRPPLQHF